MATIKKNINYPYYFTINQNKKGGNHIDGLLDNLSKNSFFKTFDEMKKAVIDELLSQFIEEYSDEIWEYFDEDMENDDWVDEYNKLSITDKLNLLAELVTNGYYQSWVFVNETIIYHNLNDLLKNKDFIEELKIYYDDEFEITEELIIDFIKNN